MNSVTIKVAGGPHNYQHVQVTIKDWLVSNLGYSNNAGGQILGNGWNIQWDSDGKNVFWIVNIEDDGAATEFKLRFL